MAEISPHQGTKSQWIEALLFLPISEILSLTWEIVVDPAPPTPSSESRLFTISTDELSRELFLYFMGRTASIQSKCFGLQAGRQAGRRGI